MKKNLRQRLIKIRRQIHKYPELGNKEYKTSKFIKSILRTKEIKIKHTGETGIIGILVGSAGNRQNIKQNCIALRADIDALPIKEQNNKSYKSRYDGIMHACGHDANTTIVLGAALELTELRNKFDGIVKFIFQPNEESAGGAQQMIKSGVLRNPHVNAIIGMHVNSQLSTGTIGIKYEEMMSAVDKFEISIFGGGGHAAYPHKGKNPILCASELIQSLQSIVTREIDPVEPVVISVTTINGGTKFNVLADKVTLTGTVRTLDKNLHRQISKFIYKHIKSITKKYALKFDFKYDILGYPLRNDSSMADLCVSAARSITEVKLLNKPSMGGEDFAEYLRYVRGCFLYIGSKRDKSTAVSWHHPKFDIDENVLPIGAAVLKEIVLEYFSSRRR